MRKAGLSVIVSALLLAAPAGGLAAPAPAPDPETLATLKSGLSGPVEAVPTAWGADPIGYDPSAVTGTSLFGEADEAPLPPPPPRDPPPVPVSRPATAAPAQTGPRAADQVGGVNVQAQGRTAAAQTVERCVIGPAWWRVTSAKTTLWIMGTPDQMPMNTTWDDTCLQKRMIAARVAIVPAIPPTSIQDPFARASTPLRPTIVPLSQRLPAPLWAQLSQRINGNIIRAQAEATWASTSNSQSMPIGLSNSLNINGDAGSHLQVRSALQVLQDTPDLYVPTLIVAQRLALSLNMPGNLGNPAAARAVVIGNRTNMLIARTTNSEAEFSTLSYLTAPSETDQQACLKKVLDEMDAGHDGAGNLIRVQAWAAGDVDNALPRMNVLNTCPFGDIGARFYSALVNQNMTLIDRAMKAGGIAVAIVEFDPLLLKNGVLDRLKAEGFTVTPPELLQ